MIPKHNLVVGFHQGFFIGQGHLAEIFDESCFDAIHHNFGWRKIGLAAAYQLSGQAGFAHLFF